MSNVVSFQNAGLIEIAAITTLGINAKEGDDAIGYFGTGLKYAIAAILRTGQRIVIYRGLEAYEFKTVSTDVRNKSFDIVYMNGQPLGFTTRLGVNWEQWMLFRELESNTRDEKGVTHGRFIEPAEGHTTIVVTGQEFYNEYLNRDHIFINTKPLYSNHIMEVHEGEGRGIYYRGVLVNATKEPTKFRYNILSEMALTEDRTVKYAWAVPMNMIPAICKLANTNFWDDALYMNTKGSFEASLEFTANSMTQELADYVSRIVTEEPYAFTYSLKTAVEQFLNRRMSYTPSTLTGYEQDQLDEAIMHLSNMRITFESPIIIVDKLGDVKSVRKNGTIYLSKEIFVGGVDDIMHTLLYESIKSRVGDDQEAIIRLSLRFALNWGKRVDKLGGFN
jgi:hypothetical protein